MDSHACLPGQLKLNGATCFLLNNNGPLSDVAVHNDITGPQGYQITATELAINGRAEKGKVACFSRTLQPAPDQPDHP